MAGNPGKDEAAAKFTAAYTPAAQAAWRGFAVLHKSIGDMSRGLTQTANNHSKADHHSVIGGRFSVALENSVPLGENTTRRVGVDKENGEIVVLDETHPGKGVYHGHVRSWEELSDKMRNALRRAGLVNKKGKIL